MTDERADGPVGARSGAAARYRKRPVEIEALWWNGTPSGAGVVLDWIEANGGAGTYHAHLMDGDFIAHPDPYLRIETLEGVITASAGDWVIRGIKGEFYPCKPDIFAATYEPVEADDAE